MRVVINTRIGGFEVNKAVYKELGLKWDGFGLPGNYELGIESDNFDQYRTDERLISAIEKVGLPENLKIIEIPDGIEWYLNESECGVESVHEKHRIWS